MSLQQITASRTNRTLVNQAPDRAATLTQRKKVMADPTLLFFRRYLDNALAEAKKTRDGMPTDLALATLHWIQVDNTGLDMAVADDRLVHARSFAGACEQLGLDVRVERKRMLLEVKAAYAAAAAARVQQYVRGRMGAVLTCAGVASRAGQQYVLGLVSVDEYEEIAGVDTPDPPARSARSRHSKARGAVGAGGASPSTNAAHGRVLRAS